MPSVLHGLTTIVWPHSLLYDILVPMILMMDRPHLLGCLLLLHMLSNSNNSENFFVRSRWASICSRFRFSNLRWVVRCAVNDMASHDMWLYCG